MNLTRDSSRLWVWFEPRSHEPTGIEAGWRARDPVAIMYGSEQDLPWHTASQNGGFAVDWVGLKEREATDASQMDRQGVWKAALVAPTECM